MYNWIKANTYLFTALFCIACTAVILVVKLKILVSYHPDISGSERSSTFGIQLVADRLPLYADPDLSPFNIIQYSPAYFYLVGLFYRMLNWDPTDIYRVQFLSRIASFALVGLAMIMVFITGHRHLRLRLVHNIMMCSVVFGLLQHWALTNSRVDSLLWLCTVGYLYCAFEAFKETRAEWNRYLVAMAVLAAMAFFAKQSGLIHCVILLGFLVYKQRWSTFFKIGGVLLASAVSLTLLFSAGDPLTLFENIFISFALPLNPLWFYSWTFKPLLPTAGLLIVVSLLIAIRWLFTSTSDMRQFLAVASFLFFGFATATSFKQGAGVGYYTEFAYTGILMVFWYFCPLIEQHKTGHLTYYLFPGLVVMALIYFTSEQVDRYKSINFYQLTSDYRDQKQVKEYIEPQLNAQDKLTVLLGNDFRGYMLQQMLFRHQIAYQDDLIYLLLNTGKRDFKEFYTLEKRGGIKFVVLPKVQSLYYYNFNYTFDSTQYDLQKVINGYQIYKRKGSVKLVQNQLTN